MTKQRIVATDAVKDELLPVDFWWRTAQEFKENGRFRFSVVEGRRFYEPLLTQIHPSAQIHQIVVDALFESVRCPNADFAVHRNAPITFDEWTLLCPDVAIWSAAIPAAAGEPVCQYPEAVVEVLSAFVLDRDLQHDLACYLEKAINDVLIVDPEMGQTYHFKPGQPERNYTSPHMLTLKCGCQITV